MVLDDLLGHWYRSVWCSWFTHDSDLRHSTFYTVRLYLPAPHIPFPRIPGFAYIWQFALSAFFVFREIRLARFRLFIRLFRFRFVHSIKLYELDPGRPHTSDHRLKPNATLEPPRVSRCPKPTKHNGRVR